MSKREFKRMMRARQPPPVYSIRLDALAHARGPSAQHAQAGVSLNSLGMDLSEDEVKRLNAVLDQYSAVFEEKTPTFPPARPVLHRIHLQEGHPPTTSPIFRMGPVELAELKKILVG
eukprot:6751741-Prorocentrum_lima.AAC.1